MFGLGEMCVVRWWCCGRRRYGNLLNLPISDGFLGGQKGETSAFLGPGTQKR